MKERIAVLENDVSYLKEMVPKIFEKLEAIHSDQLNSKTELLECKGDLEHELKVFLKQNYLSLPAADLIKSDINHKFSVAMVIMTTLSGLGMSFAWAVNHFGWV